MSSALYQGDLMHRRHHPRQHQFTYRLTSWLIDIDQLAALDKLALFGWNRPAPFSFYDRDYGCGDGRSPRQFIDALLAEQQRAPAARVELLCQVRSLGHVFNPLAIWFCYNPDDQLFATLYEVRNTFGQRHHYLVTETEPGVKTHRHQCTKAFHVSPFMAMDAEYQFRFRPPGETLSLHIHQTENQQPLLDARWRGTRQPLNNRTLWTQLLRYPFNSLKVILAIHWQALQLWRKGVKFRKGPAQPDHSLSTGSSQPSPRPR